MENIFTFCVIKFRFFTITFVISGIKLDQVTNLLRQLECNANPYHMECEKYGQGLHL